jgi:hypothetical protein
MSTEFKHTPGPLEVWCQQDKTEISGFYVIGDVGKEHACTAYVASQHDAKLYAAAPELLEALQDCYSLLREDSDTADYFPMDKIKKAIKKATGQ